MTQTLEFKVNCEPKIETLLSDRTHREDAARLFYMSPLQSRHLCLHGQGVPDRTRIVSLSRDFGLYSLMDGYCYCGSLLTPQ